MQPSHFGESSCPTHEILRESEERFRLLVEGVKDYAIFMLERDGYITTWNSGAQRIKGYQAEEIIGEHFSIFYTDEDLQREHPEEKLRIAAADGQYEEEGIRVRKDGRVKVTVSEVLQETRKSSPFVGCARPYGTYKLLP